MEILSKSHCHWVLELRTPRPATGVSRTLWAEVSPACPRKRGLSERVSDGVSLGPFGPRAPECLKSVPRVSPECQKGVPDTPETLSGHFLDTWCFGPEDHRVLQGAPPRGRQVYFTFQSAPGPLFKASKAPFLTLRVATPSGHPRQAPLEKTPPRTPPVFGDTLGDTPGTLRARRAPRDSCSRPELQKL